MQIRYRITIVFTIIVSVILLLLCTAIYFASYENRTEQFHARLYRKGISTAELLFVHKMSPEIVRNINKTSPSALQNKSLLVYDSNLNLIFNFTDQPKDSIQLSKEELNFDNGTDVYYFSKNGRELAVVNYYFNKKKIISVVSAYNGDLIDWLPKLRFILTISYFVSISIVIISGYIFSVKLVRSFSDLTDKINHISTNQLSMRLSTGTGKDELQKLAITINHLLDRLQSSFDTQRRFIDNASHELSTPMASISSQIEVALQRERTVENYQSVLQSINDDIKRLSTLVKSLLEIAKISGSAKGLDLFPVRMDELVMRLPSDLKKLNSNYEVKITIGDLEENDEELLVFGNEELIYAALRNITHNACKYSRDQTALVNLSIVDEKIVVTICDNGHGISQEDQQNIFQPFYRGSETSHLVSGSGLGLPLAFQIINLYNGELKLTSKKGEGSMFMVELPLAR